MISMLDQLKMMFKSILGSSTDASSVGIDIGMSSIKVVQLKKEGGKAVLETYGALALGQYQENGVIGQIANLGVEDLAKALTDTMQETNITSRNVVLGIPSISCIIFILQLPSAIEERALPTVIPEESKKFIPIPLTDVSLDWYVIPRREDSGIESRLVQENGGESKISVLVVATLNETLAKYTQVLQKTSLPLDALEIEVFSNIRSVLTRELFPVLIIDLGASKTKLSIIEHGVVETFRLINKGSVDMTLALSHSLQVDFGQAENLKKEHGLVLSTEHPQIPDILKGQLITIFQEANTTMLAYEKRYNKNIGKIIFTGGGSMMKGLLEYAKEHLASELVHADPFSKVDAPVFLSGVLKSTGPEFSIAVGLALKNIE